MAMNKHDWSCGRNGDHECCICHAWTAGYNTPPSGPCPGPDPGKIHQYTFIAAPGHGWLEVPLTHLLWLGIHNDVTGYSYIRGDFAYLEEDCDFSTFMNAAKKAEWNISITEQYDESGSVRNFASYTSRRLG